jgi:hypothetical protein
LACSSVSVSGPESSITDKAASVDKKVLALFLDDWNVGDVGAAQLKAALGAINQIWKK